MHSHGSVTIRHLTQIKSVYENIHVIGVCASITFCKESSSEEFENRRVTQRYIIRNSASCFLLSLKIRTIYHTSDECLIFRENRDMLVENGIDATGILLVLRLWLIKYRNPAAWVQVDHMEAHLDKRMGTPVWKDREVNVVNVGFPLIKLCVLGV